MSRRKTIISGRIRVRELYHMAYADIVMHAIAECTLTNVAHKLTVKTIRMLGTPSFDRKM